MRQETIDPLASVIFDGEGDGSVDEEKLRARLGEQIEDLGRISDALSVPGDIAKVDPFFVVRFRQRRDQMLASSALASPWRWVALGLLPLAASAVLTAAAVLWISGARAHPMHELEMRALGNGLADVTFETTEVEPVLRIALSDL